MASDAPLPLPSHKLTLQAFYEEYVPALGNALLGALAGPSPWPFACKALVGDAGAEVQYVIRVDGQHLQCSPGSADDVLFSWRCDKESFRLLAFDALPRFLRAANKAWSQVCAHAEALRRLPGYSPDLLLEHPGTLRVVYSDDAGDTAHMTVCIGSGNGPEVEVQLSEDDLFALLKSQGNILKLMQSRLRISGDLAYVWRLAAAFPKT